MEKNETKTTIRNEKLFCLNCGGEYVINYPISVTDMGEKMKAFDELHNNCEKTWTEPKADENKGVSERAMWWIANGEHGMSSKTMWNCMMGTKQFPVNHPYDPDDFKRCYKLLGVVPEWKADLHKMKSLSKPWRNLIDNWDKLTAMYEANVLNNWKSAKEIGMYEFMQTLIR